MWQQCMLGLITANGYYFKANRERFTLTFDLVTVEEPQRHRPTLRRLPAQRDDSVGGRENSRHFQNQVAQQADGASRRRDAAVKCSVGISLPAPIAPSLAASCGSARHPHPARAGKTRASPAGLGVFSAREEVAKYKYLVLIQTVFLIAVNFPLWKVEEHRSSFLL